MRNFSLSFILIALIACTPQPEALSLTELTSPAGDNSSLPRLFTDNTETVFMSWVEESGEMSTLYYSKLEGSNWSTPTRIAESDSWFVNWADYPSVIANDGKAMAAHWLKKIPGNRYSYNVEVTSVASNWTESTVPHTDNTATEHGFVSMVPMSDSTFLSIWLDGRNTGGGHGSYGNLEHAMTLRSAVLSEELEVLEEAEIDASVCDCCGTATVKTTDGYLVAYRNRTENEIRDIYFSEYRNGSWSEPASVHDDNWEIAACPVNGPALSSSGNKTAVAWYTAANDTAQVKLSFKDANEPGFSTPLIIHENTPLGRVDVQVLNDQSTIVSWMERDPENPEKAMFKARHFSSENAPLQSYELSVMNSSRSSGFPQITNSPEGLIAAWTEISPEDQKRVRTAILN